MHKLDDLFFTFYNGIEYSYDSITILESAESVSFFFWDRCTLNIEAHVALLGLVWLIVTFGIVEFVLAQFRRTDKSTVTLCG